MSIYCKHCGTENEDKYTYCKNCGAPLKSKERPNTQQSYRYDYYADKIPDEIDGIPSKEFGFFINKNQYKILDKFAKMSITGSKIAWCWPAALLSFFFGFFGATLWLFYRKMYKYGAVALAAGIIIAGVNTAVTYAPTVEYMENITNAAYELKGETPDYDAFLASFNAATEKYAATRQIGIANFINEASNYSASLFYGLFGMYLYKKHATRRINTYRAVNRESEYYNYGLSAIGGTSAGMAVLAVFIVIILNNFLSAIPLFSFFIF